MRKILSTVALAATLTVCAEAGSAQAGTQLLDFSYNYGSGDIVGGALDGTLSANGNDFIISGFEDFTVNGVAISGFDPAVFGSEDAFQRWGEGYSGDGSGTVTLDGSYMDFVAGDSTNAIGFAVNDATSLIVGNVTAAAGAFGNVPEAIFNPANWSASVQTVPEPASYAALLVGLMALGFVKRRRSV